MPLTRTARDSSSNARPHSEPLYQKLQAQPDNLSIPLRRRTARDFLRRIALDRDWGQIVVHVAAAIDPHTLSQGLDTRAGNNTFNHADKHVDTLIDRMREAATEESFLQAGYDFQRYIVENMITTSISSYGFLQAARTYVKGYENLHGYKLRFETTWLDK